MKTQLDTCCLSLPSPWLFYRFIFFNALFSGFFFLDFFLVGCFVYMEKPKMFEEDNRCHCGV